MDFNNFGINEFLAIIFITPVFYYLTLILFEGIGIFKDNFYISQRKWR